MGNYLFRKKLVFLWVGPEGVFANLFLYDYERQWLLNLKKKDLAKARKFGNTFRFIDDFIDAAWQRKQGQ